MGFNDIYIRQFHKVAESICAKYSYADDDIEIGEFLTCPFPPEAIKEVVDIWVTGIEKLLRLTEDTSSTVYSIQFTELYRHRGITFDEYFYLFSDTLSEEEYLKTPAYIFTKSYSMQLRNRRFTDFEYSPDT